jgi:hypothetical protein
MDLLMRINEAQKKARILEVELQTLKQRATKETFEVDTPYLFLVCEMQHEIITYLLQVAKEAIETRTLN